jgi:hypothetical protein
MRSSLPLLSSSLFLFCVSSFLLSLFSFLPLPCRLLRSRTLYRQAAEASAPPACSSGSSNPLILTLQQRELQLSFKLHCLALSALVFFSLSLYIDLQRRTYARHLWGIISLLATSTQWTLFQSTGHR